MDTLKLSELIGQEILELKFHYVPENEYGLQSFHSYIKLANDTIIDIPHFDDDEYLQLTQDNLIYLKTMFDTQDNLLTIKQRHILSDNGSWTFTLATTTVKSNLTVLHLLNYRMATS